MGNSGSKIQKVRVTAGKLLKICFLMLSLLKFNEDSVLGQIGGNGTYQFLDLTNSAKIAALGGTQISLTDNDVALPFYNPSLLSDSMKNQITVNYASYIAGIGVGYAAYAPNIRGRNNFAAGIHFVNYGTFDGASETGQVTGTFKAAEYSINLFFSRELISGLRIGVNLKPIFSSFESYSSYGLAADLGLFYSSISKRTSVSIVSRNMGSQITTYYQGGVRENLPWDLLLGFSRHLTNAPVNFLVTADHLNLWDLGYIDPATSQFPSSSSRENFSTKLMRHLIFGIEFSPEQHLTLRLGYNYQRRKELSVESHPGLVGYSAGIGVKIAKFNINYGIASFHLAATVHYLSLTTSLSEFIH